MVLQLLNQQISSWLDLIWNIPAESSYIVVLGFQCLPPPHTVGLRLYNPFLLCIPFIKCPGVYITDRGWTLWDELVIGQTSAEHLGEILRPNQPLRSVLVAQLCLTFSGPMDCSLPGRIHGILQARILEWVAIPSSRDLPNPGIKPGSPTLQVDSLPPEPLGIFFQPLIKGKVKFFERED